MRPNPVTLGQKYSDAITGFEGTATARSVYLNGNVKVLLETVGEDGMPADVWIDEYRLLLVETTGGAGFKREVSE